jgi:hypothetical protein
VPERSPERAKLAAAIEYLDALDNHLGRLAEARNRLGLRDKEFAVTSARAGIEEANKRAPQVLIAKAMGEPYDIVETVEHAQSRLGDAQRELDEAVAADAVLAAEITGIQGRRSLAELTRESALCDVLKNAPELAALAARYETAKQAVRDIAWTFSAIGIHRLPFFWDGVCQGSNNGSGAPWKAAIAALQSDPDAALPSE